MSDNLAAMLERGKQHGVKLYYIGDGLWSAELWGRSQMHEETGATPIEALALAYKSLDRMGGE